MTQQLEKILNYIYLMLQEEVETLEMESQAKKMILAALQKEMNNYSLSSTKTGQSSGQ